MKFSSPLSQALVWLLTLALLSGCGGNADAVPTVAAGTTITATATVKNPAGLTPQPAALSPTVALASSTATAFRLPTATTTRTPVPQVVLPSVTPQCENNLLYIEDLTVPDGAIVPAGTVFDKRWRIENNGSCNWNGQYRLQRISGPDLGLGDEQALYPARSGAQAIIRMLLTAPAEPGAYRSAWQAVDPQGQLFGDPIFVDILVNG